MSNVAQWRRVIVVDGTHRRQVLLSTGSSVMESLQNEGINMYSRSVLVVGADGSQIDVAAVPKLADGALLTVIDLGAVGTSAPARAPRRSPRRFDFAQSLWSGVGFLSLVVTLIFAAGTSGASGSNGSFGDILGRYAAVVVLTLLSLVAAIGIRSRSGEFSPAVLFVPAALAFSAGFIAIPVSLEASTQLAVFTGLLGAAVVQGAVHVRYAGTVATGSTGLVTLVLAVLAGVWGITLVAGFGASVAAALVAGAAPVALRVLPALCLDIPEGQLLEYGEFMRNRWTVRGQIPPPSVPVTARDMARTMSRAQWQLRTGTVVFSLLPVLAMPILLFSGVTDAIAGIATIVLVAAIVLSFLLSPRQANTAITRWSPRIAAAIVGLEFALWAIVGKPSIAALVATIIVVLGALVIAAAMVPIARGARSLGISRTADIFESLSTALVFPAAFVAANLIDILRGVVS